MMFSERLVYGKYDFQRLQGALRICAEGNWYRTCDLGRLGTACFLRSRLDLKTPLRIFCRLLHSPGFDSRCYWNKKLLLWINHDLNHNSFHPWSGSVNSFISDRRVSFDVFSSQVVWNPNTNCESTPRAKIMDQKHNVRGKRNAIQVGAYHRSRK